LLRDSCRTTVGQRPSELLQYLPCRRRRALTSADWRVEQLLLVLQKSWRLGLSADGERR
jgi:hypothetical protein